MPRKKTTSDPNRHYVDNKKFYAEIKKYKEKVKESREAGNELDPIMPDYVAKSIWDCVHNFSFSKNFINYTFREDMVLDGYENCIKYFHNFNADKYDNPHAYFTMIASNAFKQRILLEERERYVKYKSFIDQTSFSEIADYMNEEGLQFGMVYDNLYEFVQNFERKEAERKQKRKDAKDEKLKNEQISREASIASTD